MREFLQTAITAGKDAGVFLKDHFGTSLHVDEYEDYDIKLALDVQTQNLITDILLKAHPDHAIYGEEGISGNQESPYQWIVDPLDGTVNYFYGLPHFCTSIALRHHQETIVGVIYDPILDELFSVVKGEPAYLNGKEITVSTRHQLRDTIVYVGFSKTKRSMDAGFKRFQELAYAVRKTRTLGSAALAMAYVACGRLDAFIEEVLNLWDIAAGKLLIEAAGGKVIVNPSPVEEDKLEIISSNGSLPLE